jgi:hypothetical protein
MVGDAPHDTDTGLAIGAFAVGVRPSFRKPGNVETSVAVVRDGVDGVGIGETDGGFGGGMGSDSELCAAW